MILGRAAVPVLGIARVVMVIVHHNDAAAAVAVVMIHIVHHLHVHSHHRAHRHSHHHTAGHAHTTAASHATAIGAIAVGTIGIRLLVNDSGSGYWSCSSPAFNCDCSWLSVCSLNDNFGCTLSNRSSTSTDWIAHLLLLHQFLLLHHHLPLLLRCQYRQLDVKNLN